MKGEASFCQTSVRATRHFTIASLRHKGKSLPTPENTSLRQEASLKLKNVSLPRNVTLSRSVTSSKKRHFVNALLAKKESLRHEKIKKIDSRISF